MVYGGIPIAKDKELLKEPPHIIIGTPGRVLALIKDKTLNLEKLTQFVLDECDKCLEKLGWSVYRSDTVSDNKWYRNHCFAPAL